MSEFKISVHDLFPLIKKTKLSVHTHFLKTEQICCSFNLEWWDLLDCLNAGGLATDLTVSSVIQRPGSCVRVIRGQCPSGPHV